MKINIKIDTTGEEFYQFINKKIGEYFQKHNLNIENLQCSEWDKTFEVSLYINKDIEKNEIDINDAIEILWKKFNIDVKAFKGFKYSLKDNDDDFDEVWITDDTELINYVHELCLNSEKTAFEYAEELREEV